MEDRLCWLRAPLFKLEKGGKKMFAYDETELARIKNGRETWTQTRLKGLGEFDAEDMEVSMLHPTNRRLEILTLNDVEAAEKSLIMLMGKEVEERRDFLFNNVDFSILN